MHAPEKFTGREQLILLVTKNETGVTAAPRPTRDGIPFEGNHLASRQSIGQPVIAVLECCLFMPPLGEESGEHERAS